MRLRGLSVPVAGFMKDLTRHFAGVESWARPALLSAAWPAPMLLSAAAMAHITHHQCTTRDLPVTKNYTFDKCEQLVVFLTVAITMVFM